MSNTGPPFKVSYLPDLPDIPGRATTPKPGFRPRPQIVRPPPLPIQREPYFPPFWLRLLIIVSLQAFTSWMPDPDFKKVCIFFVVFAWIAFIASIGKGQAIIFILKAVGIILVCAAIWYFVNPIPSWFVLAFLVSWYIDDIHHRLDRIEKNTKKED